MLLQSPGWLEKTILHTNFIVIGAIDNETVSIFEEPHRVEKGQTEHEGMFN